MTFDFPLYEHFDRGVLVLVDRDADDVRTAWIATGDAVAIEQ